MTLAKRISIVRTLNIIQVVLTSLAGVAGMGIVGLVMWSARNKPENFSDLSPLMLPMMMVMGIIAIALAIGLPVIVLAALKKRKSEWAMAAFVSLILQIVLGGGIMSLFPIISLVLLLDKEASAYIGMK